MLETKKRVHAIQLDNIADRRVTKRDCKKFIELHGGYFNDYEFLGDMDGNETLFCAIHFTYSNTEAGHLEADGVHDVWSEHDYALLTFGDYLVFDEGRFFKVGEADFENAYEVIPENTYIDLNFEM